MTTVKQQPCSGITRQSWNATKGTRKQYVNNGVYYISHLLNISLTYILIRAIMNFKDATSAMAFYGVYHRNPYNQLIHFFGVPGIIYSLFVFQCHLPLSISSSSPTSQQQRGGTIMIDFVPGIPSHPINYATVWVVIYILFYLSIDVFGAIFYAPCLYYMYSSAIQWVLSDQVDSRKRIENKSKSLPTKTLNWMGSGKPLLYAGLIHFVSWYIQIKLGHELIEHAQPAVLQSIGGAFSAAPLFAFYEFVWLIGLCKEFQYNVLTQVATYTKELCTAGTINIQACNVYV